MPITPLKQESSNLTLFVQGPPGSGKTTLAIELAESLPKKSLFLDYDRKLATQANLTPAQAAKIDVWTPTAPPNTLELVDKGTVQKNPNSYLDLIKTINSLPTGEAFPYSLACLDTFTNFAEDMEGFWAQKLNFSRSSKGDASFAFWDNVGSNLMAFVQGFKRLPCMVIVNVHIQHEKDDVTGAIVTTPTISSKKRYTIGKEFDEAYVLQGMTGRDFTALVVGNNRYVARTGLNITKPVATLKEIKEALIKHAKAF